MQFHFAVTAYIAWVFSDRAVEAEDCSAGLARGKHLLMWYKQKKPDSDSRTKMYCEASALAALGLEIVQQVTINKQKRESQKYWTFAVLYLPEQPIQHQMP